MNDLTQKRKPGRPAKNAAVILPVITPVDMPVKGLQVISEAEYNKLNGIVEAISVPTPQPTQVEGYSTDKRRVGTFIVVNTPTISGIRLNLEKVRTYAKAGSDRDIVTIAWDNGTSSGYALGTEAAAFQFLEYLDSYCL